MVLALVRPSSPAYYGLVANAPCSHIDWHLEAGLAIVFAESPADNIAGPQSQIFPADAKALCPQYDALGAELQ